MVGLSSQWPAKTGLTMRLAFHYSGSGLLGQVGLYVVGLSSQWPAKTGLTV